MTRRAALRAGSAMVRRTGLRRAPVARTRPRLRTSIARPSPEELLAKDLVSARSGDRCEFCGSTANDWAHRMARSQLGRWEATNGLALCRPCHDWCHDNPSAAKAAGLILESSRSPATAPVWLPRCGWVYLTPDGEYLRAPQEPAPQVLPPTRRCAR